MKFSRKWPKVPKIDKCGHTETISAQFLIKVDNWNVTYPTYSKPFYKNALLTLATKSNRSKDIADFSQKFWFFGVSGPVFREYLHTHYFPGKVTLYKTSSFINMEPHATFKENRMESFWDLAFLVCFLYRYFRCRSGTLPVAKRPFTTRKKLTPT